MRFLDLLHEYAFLRAKRETLEIPLDDGEDARLWGLERLLRGDRGPAEARHLPRLLCPLPVQLTMAGTFASGRLRNVSGEGACVHTSAAMRAGSRLLLHIHDARGGVEYVFPSRVVWRRGGTRPAIGLAFEGVPIRNPLPEDRGPAGPRPRRVTPMVA